MDKIRLLLGSDDALLRRGLTTIFTSEGSFDVVGSFSLNEAIDRSIADQPDVVVLDISEDIARNEQNFKRIKGECPCSLIVAIIDDDQHEYLGDLVSQGVDGCITKGMMRGCLVKTLELICRAGIICLPGSAKNKVTFNRLDTQNRSVVRLESNFPETLTRREVEVLRLMAKNYSNLEIGRELYISEPTVKTHVSNILRKLGQNSRAQAAIYAYKNGLIS